MKNVNFFILVAFGVISIACSNSKSIGTLEKKSIKTTEAIVTNESSSKPARSFQTALKVDSIPAENAYVRKVCEGCSFKQQSLLYKDGIPYDVLLMQKPDGSTVEYYFDISNFFSKW